MGRRQALFVAAVVALLVQVAAFDPNTSKRILRADNQNDDDSSQEEERTWPSLETLKRLFPTNRERLYVLDKQAAAAAAAKENEMVKEMSSQVKHWILDEKTISSVKWQLSLTYLSDDALVASPLYKVYQEFLSPENVKKVLGFDKMTDEAIKVSPKYDSYVTLMAAHTDDVMMNWARKDASTFEAWTTLGLEKLSHVDLLRSDNYKTYVKCVTKMDADGDWLARNALRESSEAELKARVGIWAVQRKSEELVKTGLGLDKLTEVELRKNKNYQYYEEFVKSVS